MQSNEEAKLTFTLSKELDEDILKEKTVSTFGAHTEGQADVQRPRCQKTLG